MTAAPSVVLVDDDNSFRQIMGRELQRSGFVVHRFPSAEGVREFVAADAPDVVLLDLTMPGKSGMELLRELIADSPDVQVVVLTGHGSVPEAVEAMRLGARDFLTKPVGLEVLEQALHKAASTTRLIIENRALRRAAAASRGDVAPLESRESRRLEAQIARIAPSDKNVLITGESGVGKELVARRLHAASARRDKLFVSVNCAAIPSNLIESELFGHRRGAFTGAAEKRTGLFDAADGGTLFLDEIGELPLPVQAALLRAVQFGEVRPVGSDASHRVDVRLIAATNRDLRDLVDAGTFREDLYYRLAVLELHVAPLRERPDDVLVLARHFLAKEASRSERTLTLTPDAERWLAAQSWPGNVRELENAIVRVAVLAPQPVVDEATLRELAAGRPPARGRALPTLRLRELEQMAIEQALARHGGNKRLAAEELGMALKTLYNRLARTEDKG